MSNNHFPDKPNITRELKIQVRDTILNLCAQVDKENFRMLTSAGRMKVAREVAREYVFANLERLSRLEVRHDWFHCGVTVTAICEEELLSSKGSLLVTSSIHSCYINSDGELEWIA